MLFNKDKCREKLSLLLKFSHLILLLWISRKNGSKTYVRSYIIFSLQIFFLTKFLDWRQSRKLFKVKPRNKENRQSLGIFRVNRSKYTYRFSTVLDRDSWIMNKGKNNSPVHEGGVQSSNGESYRVFQLDMIYFEVLWSPRWPTKNDFHVQKKVAAH